jgi:hypothetical protein
MIYVERAVSLGHKEVYRTTSVLAAASDLLSFMVPDGEVCKDRLQTLLDGLYEDKGLEGIAGFFIKQPLDFVCLREGDGKVLTYYGFSDGVAQVDTYQ